MTENADVNIARAGEFFMLCLWLQGQMTDLIILESNPEYRKPFVSSPEKIPREMALIRADYWQKDFSSIKKEFETVFGDLVSEAAREDLVAIGALRNAIAHCHVSVGRDYLLYRPSRGEKQENEIIAALKLKPARSQSEPILLKISLYDDKRYFKDFDRIKRLDEQCFKEIASHIGIPHGRIR